MCLKMIVIWWYIKKTELNCTCSRWHPNVHKTPQYVHLERVPYGMSIQVAYHFVLDRYLVLQYVCEFIFFLLDSLKTSAVFSDFSCKDLSIDYNDYGGL